MLCGHLLPVGVGIQSRDDVIDGRRPRPFLTFYHPSSLFDPEAIGETSAAACPDFRYAVWTLSTAWTIVLADMFLAGGIVGGGRIVVGGEIRTSVTTSFSVTMVLDDATAFSVGTVGSVGVAALGLAAAFCLFVRGSTGSSDSASLFSAKALNLELQPSAK